MVRQAAHRNSPQIDGPRLMLGQEYIARNLYGQARKTLKPLAYSPHDSVDQQKAKGLLAMIDEKEGKAEAAPVEPAS